MGEQLDVCRVDPTEGWRGLLTIPRVLEVREIDGVAHLHQAPTGRLVEHRAGHVRIDDAAERAVREVFDRRISGAAFELRLRVDRLGSAAVGVRVHVGNGSATSVELDGRRSMVRLDRSTSSPDPFHAAYPRAYEAPLRSTHLDGPVELRVVVDTSLVEVFAAGVSISALAFPPPSADRVELYADGHDGPVTFDVWSLTTDTR